MQTHGVSCIFPGSGCVYLDVHRAMHRGGQWAAAAASAIN